jgi:hypothetical protein
LNRSALFILKAKVRTAPDKKHSEEALLREKLVDDFQVTEIFRGVIFAFETKALGIVVGRIVADVNTRHSFAYKGGKKSRTTSNKNKSRKIRGVPIFSEARWCLLSKAVTMVYSSPDNSYPNSCCGKTNKRKSQPAFRSNIKENSAIKSS